MSALDKTQIAEGKQRIEELEQKVAEMKEKTAAAVHNLKVETRYASRVQNVARGQMSKDEFAKAMNNLINADKNALDKRGE